MEIITGFGSAEQRNPEQGQIVVGHTTRLHTSTLAFMNFIPITPPATPIPEQDECQICHQLGFYYQVSSLHYARGTPKIPSVYKPEYNSLQPWKEAGSLSDVVERGKRCSTCQLLVKVVQTSDLNQIQPWDPKDQVYVRLRYSSYTYETFTAAAENTTIVFARFLVSRQRIDRPLASHLDGIIAPTRPQTQDLGPLDNFFGRRLEETINMEMISKWIASCDAKHYECWQLMHKPSKFVSFMSNAPHSLKVIDVQLKRITDIPANWQYTTLSYVWGKDTKQIVLTKANEPKLSKDYGLEEVSNDISRTIKDAMMVISKLGRRYLWVDSLCIIQDDPDTKHHWILNMGQVYKMASLTIVAGDGLDANAGLWGTSDGTNRKEQLSAKNASNEFVALEHPQARQNKFENSIYSRRAWTFQEYLLSPRLLVFFEGRVHLQCRTTCFHEDMILDSSCPTINEADRLYTTTGTSTVEKLQFHYRAYQKIVAQYTKRKLSFQEDVLRAFAGITSLVTTTLASQLHSGIPVRYYDSLLLWLPEAPLQRRVGFPSWSWTGWIGPVRYWASGNHHSSPLAWAKTAGYITWTLANREVNPHVPPISQAKFVRMLYGHVANVQVYDPYGGLCPAPLAPCDAAVGTNVLTFWCFIAKFNLGPDTLEEQRMSNKGSGLAYARYLDMSPTLGNGLARRDILGANHCFCGTVLTHTDDIEEMDSIYLVVLSETYQSSEGTCPFLNVMAVSLVETPREYVAATQRIGTGQIYKAALDMSVESLGWTRLSLI